MIHPILLGARLVLTIYILRIFPMGRLGIIS